MSGHPGKAYEMMPFEELSDAPVEALEGLPKHDSGLLGKAFNIRTIANLAEHRFVLRAQAIVNLTKAHFAKSTTAWQSQNGRHHRTVMSAFPELRSVGKVHRNACLRKEDDMLHWLWVVVIGVVIGALAKFVMPGKDPGGFIITALLGIAGSVIATIFGHAVGWYGPGESAGFIMSVIGAIVLLAIYRFMKGRPVTR